MSNIVESDINKIIKAKKILYDKILDILEKEANEDMIGESNLKGGFNLREIGSDIKILGNITLPNISDNAKITSKLERLSIPQVMNMEQASKYTLTMEQL